MRIFFAGPLTNLVDPNRIKTFYKKLAETAKAQGYDYFWAFLNGTDPIKNPDVTPQAVYEVDTQELAKSDIMVAYVGEPSTGTGIEIEFAKTRDIPVYLLYEKDRRISRMLRGCPAIKGEIAFQDEADAIAQFGALLTTLAK